MKYTQEFCSHCKGYAVHFSGGDGEMYCMRHESHMYKEHLQTKIEKVRYLLLEMNLSEDEMIRIMGFLHDQVQYKKNVDEILRGSLN